MYKLLLSWRYLKTRFIALASIVSVTLGVATLIVVNSVMAGFVDEMKVRLHGILSDIELEAGLDEIHMPNHRAKEIEEVIGDDLVAMTFIVRVPAFMTFDFRGRQWTEQILLMGIDERTYGDVTDFHPHLMNENKRTEVNFELEQSGYHERLGEAGWDYRRTKFGNQIRLQQLLDQSSSRQPSSFAPQASDSFEVARSDYQPPADLTAKPATNKGDQEFYFPELPDEIPDFEQLIAERAAAGDKASEARIGDEIAFSGFDSHADLRPQVRPEDMFNPTRDQHTGMILGLALSSRKYVDQESGDTKEIFMLRPGDDVQVTLPTAGRMSAVSENCTVVDFYNSNMHEYDSSFAFMPLKRLQELRKMIDPITGAASVNTIQIRVKDNANLSEIRDKLAARFPPSYYPFSVQTWQDRQRPLLSAVNLELTILNILLFLIIAVAGFGILATFFMIVVEKTKDIGILKALGAPSRGVMSIFLGYGVSLGAVGTGVGIVLGLMFVHWINDIANIVQVVTGQEIFDPTIYYFSEIPTIVSPFMIVMVAIGAIGIAVLASVLPALRAARLHPVEALRYE